MLLNPYAERHLLQTFGDSRILVNTFGVIGAQVPDELSARKKWTVVGLYAPVTGRAFGGVRAKITDGTGVVSFINQRDLEIRLGLAVAGNVCKWTGKQYPSPDSAEWLGICADEEDMLDDLYDNELLVRAGVIGTCIPHGSEFKRKYYPGEKHIITEVMTIIYDGDMVRGVVPDPRFQTIRSRWKIIEAKKELVVWEA